MRHVGYGAYGMGAGFGTGFGVGCDPAKATTCGTDGVCYDENGCPQSGDRDGAERNAPTSSTAAQAQAYWKDLEKKLGPKGPGVMDAYLKYEDLAEKERKAGGSKMPSQKILLIGGASLVGLVILILILKR